MDMTVPCVGAILLCAGALLVGLIRFAFKVATLTAELRGVERTLERMKGTNNGNGAGGCIMAFAIIGFLTVCVMCVYIGIAVSSAAN